MLLIHALDCQPRLKASARFDEVLEKANIHAACQLEQIRGLLGAAYEVLSRHYRRVNFDLPLGCFIRRDSKYLKNLDYLRDLRGDL